MVAAYLVWRWRNERRRAGSAAWYAGLSGGGSWFDGLALTPVQDSKKVDSDVSACGDGEAPGKKGSPPPGRWEALDRGDGGGARYAEYDLSNSPLSTPSGILPSLPPSSGPTAAARGVGKGADGDLRI